MLWILYLLSAKRAKSPLGKIWSRSESASAEVINETVAPPSIVISKLREPSLTLKKRLGMGVIEPMLGVGLIEQRQWYPDVFIDLLITLEAPW